MQNILVVRCFYYLGLDWYFSRLWFSISSEDQIQSLAASLQRAATSTTKLSVPAGELNSTAQTLKSDPSVANAQAFKEANWNSHLGNLVTSDTPDNTNTAIDDDKLKPAREWKNKIIIVPSIVTQWLNFLTYVILLFVYITSLPSMLLGNLVELIQKLTADKKTEFELDHSKQQNAENNKKLGKLILMKHWKYRFIIIPSIMTMWSVWSPKTVFVFHGDKNPKNGFSGWRKYASEHIDKNPGGQQPQDKECDSEEAKAIVHGRIWHFFDILHVINIFLPFILYTHSIIEILWTLAYGYYRDTKKTAITSYNAVNNKQVTIKDCSTDVPKVIGNTSNNASIASPDNPGATLTITNITPTANAGTTLDEIGETPCTVEVGTDNKTLTIKYDENNCVTITFNNGNTITKTGDTTVHYGHIFTEGFDTASPHWEIISPTLMVVVDINPYVWMGNWGLYHRKVCKGDGTPSGLGVCSGITVATLTTQISTATLTTTSDKKLELTLKTANATITVEGDDSSNGPYTLESGNLIVTDIGLNGDGNEGDSYTLTSIGSLTATGLKLKTDSVTIKQHTLITLKLTNPKNGVELTVNTSGNGKLKGPLFGFSLGAYKVTNSEVTLKSNSAPATISTDPNDTSELHSNHPGNCCICGKQYEWTSNPMAWYWNIFTILVPLKICLPLYSYTVCTTH